MTSACGSANDARGTDGPGSRPRDWPAGDGLTPRERVVLAHLVERLSYAEIAERMFISVNTVKAHVPSVYAKLGVHGRRGAIERVHELGIFGDG